MTSPESERLEQEEGGEAPAAPRVRLMTEADLPIIIALDRKATGHARTRFYEEKMSACLREPAVNTSLIAEVDGSAAGFLMGRLFFGEFGIPAARAVLDAIGVNPNSRGRSVGATLVRQYQKNLAGLRVEAVDTLVDLARTDLLAFFQKMGFHPSRSVDLVWNVGEYPFSGASGKGAKVRPAQEGDMAAVAGIDQEATQTNRSDFLRKRLQNTAAQPDRNVFLVAELDGKVAGFTIGGLFQGEFGMDVTRGVIDSFTVGDDYRHRGVGSAIMEQLLGRIKHLDITRMETLCRWNDWELLQFFEYVGFRPGGRVNLEHRFAG